MMKKYFVAFSLSSLFLTGCAGTIGSAYEDYGKDNYGSALKKVADLEAYRVEVPASLDVQIAFLKASIFEKQNKPEEAKGMYKYIVDKYPSDKLGYSAKERLAVMDSGVVKESELAPKSKK